MSCSAVNCLISKYVGKFSDVDFEINSVVVREYALYDFDPVTFIDTQFMAGGVFCRGDSSTLTCIVLWYSAAAE